MDNLEKEKRNKEMQTALGITENRENKTSDVVNEDAPVSNRRGRKGADLSTQSPYAKNTKISSSFQIEVFRVVISKDANDALESALSRCADGFDSGTITKSDVANYIFQNVSKFFQDSDVKNLRAAHFDEKKMLGSILRADADLPEDLRKAIRAHFGIYSERDKKRPAKQSEAA